MVTKTSVGHLSKNRKISVMGLGYVGLPVATAFAKNQPVIAFDINSQRINQLKQGFDITGEVSLEDLRTTQLHLTTHAPDLKQADFHIITVPSSINRAKQPDFSHLIHASSLLGPNLKQGDIIVYESTVYPGATEEKCLPILENTSGLVAGKDFFIGYSPERINPGDKEHTFSRIPKIISAQTPEALEIVAHVYSQVVKAGVYPVSSIKVAEAAKAIENTQRDINIALVNELSLICHQLDIDTEEVLQAAGTKWNFLPFKPGLVGGHCIGVDPYYLTHKAIECGIYPEVILAGRRINDNLGRYIAQQIVKQLVKLGKPVKNSRVGILGITFKEDCPDIRNSGVVKIIHELQDYHVNVITHDPLADHQQVQHEYGIQLAKWDELVNLDVLVFAVTHSSYKEVSCSELISKMADPKLLIDIKSALPLEILQKQGVTVWRL